MAPGRAYCGHGAGGGEPGEVTLLRLRTVKVNHVHLATADTYMVQAT